jgi:hypothetical protein
MEIIKKKNWRIDIGKESPTLILFLWAKNGFSPIFMW